MRSGSRNQAWGLLLQEARKNRFYEKKEREAKSLIESDNKVHIKKIAVSVYQLLEYAGYSDSRESVICNNRDSNKQLSTLRKVYVTG